MYPDQEQRKQRLSTIDVLLTALSEEKRKLQDSINALNHEQEALELLDMVEELNAQ